MLKITNDHVSQTPLPPRIPIRQPPLLCSEISLKEFHLHTLPLSMQLLQLNPMLIPDIVVFAF